VNSIIKPKSIDLPGKIRFSDAIEIGDHVVTLIDTPGIDGQGDVKLLELVAEELDKK
jgi:hypothetical protein